MARSTTTFLWLGVQAKNMFGKSLCVQGGVLESWKWVSCTQSMSTPWLQASCYMVNCLAGWFRPLALIERHLMVIAGLE